MSAKMRFSMESILCGQVDNGGVTGRKRPHESCNKGEYVGSINKCKESKSEVLRVRKTFIQISKYLI